VIVDADVHVFPSDAAAVALASAVARDAATDLIELAKLFDVDVDQLARPPAKFPAPRPKTAQYSSSRAICLLLLERNQRFTSEFPT
jgi:hypothetical protein